MIFLIEYDRPKRSLVRFKSFDDSMREEVQKFRLQIEFDLRSQQIEHEVVLLEAVSEEALRKTHRRYVEDTRQIGEAIRDNAA